MGNLLTIFLAALGFEFALGGGYSSFGYKVASEGALETLNANATGNYSLDAHLSMNIFFCDYFGIGLGADIDRFGGATHLQGDLLWHDVTDTDGELYDHHLHIHSWKEKQFATYLAPQLMFVGVIPAGNMKITLGAGAEYGILLGNIAYQGEGKLTHTGFYRPWNLTLHDVDAHGFYTSDSFKPNGKYEIQSGSLLALVARAGVAIPVHDNWDILVNAVFKYSVWTNITAGGANPIGFQDDAVNHYFISDYSSLLTTPATQGTIAPWMVGLEVGIRYTFPFKKKSHYSCICLED